MYSAFRKEKNLGGITNGWKSQLVEEPTGGRANGGKSQLVEEPTGGIANDHRKHIMLETQIALSNFARLYYMLSDLGRARISCVVKANLPGNLNLEEYLNLETTQERHKRLLKAQREVFYPEFDENKVDITLWCKLAEDCQNLTRPCKESVRKIQELRNQLLHVGDLGNFNFVEPWREAESALRNLGASDREISEHVNKKFWSLECLPFDETSVVQELHTESGKLLIMPRWGWRAKQPSSPRTPLKLPVKYIVISQSVKPDTPGNRITTKEICRTLAAIQHNNMAVNGWFDIAFNFLIGDDGVVYKGRGCNWEGSTAKGWNKFIFGFCFVGAPMPSPAALNAFHVFVQYLVSEKKLREDFVIICLRQIRPFPEAPNDEVYEEIKTWTHWRRYVDESEPNNA